MSVSDPIADMLTAIRNANTRSKEKLDVPGSKIKGQILDVFKREGYIQNYKSIEYDQRKSLRIYLKFTEGGKPAIINIRRISKPSLRVYAKKGKIPRVLRGMGVAILSTSRGILTDREARRQNIGGEILCHVW